MSRRSEDVVHLRNQLTSQEEKQGLTKLRPRNDKTGEAGDRVVTVSVPLLKDALSSGQGNVAAAK